MVIEIGDKSFFTLSELLVTSALLKINLLQTLNLTRLKKNRIIYFRWLEVVVQRFPVKEVFLEISQNSQENTCARVSFLIKMQVLSLQLYLKRDSGTGVFL